MTPRERKYHRRRKVTKLMAKREALILCQERIIKAMQLTQIAVESAQQAIKTFGERVSIRFADPLLN